MSTTPPTQTPAGRSPRPAAPVAAGRGPQARPAGDGAQPRDVRRSGRGGRLAPCSLDDPSVFAWMVTAWLWLTVIFANLAEAVAEGRGRAQAATLRKARTDTSARTRLTDEKVKRSSRPPSCGRRSGGGRAGEVIPGDGDVIEGVASVDESAITGESAPVIRESGGDRSAVTGGTRVLSDHIVVQITSKPGETFIDRMIALVEGASRQKTPNEIALNILLASLTIIFLLAVVSLQPLAVYSGQRQSIIVLVALLVCLIPTTIGALALGDRHRRNGPTRAAQRPGHVGAGGRGRR